MKILIVSICVFIASSIIFDCQGEGVTSPAGKDGVLDLRNWDFEKDGVVKLTGEWDFFWQEFLTSDDFTKNKQPIKSGQLNSPGLWRFQDLDIPGLEWYGYATLKLKVLLPKGANNLMLELKDLRTAYELEVNGELVTKCGVIGTTEKSSIPEFSVKRPIIKVKNQQVDIIVRISDFHRDSGGMSLPILLGTNEQIIRSARNAVIEEWLLIGFLLFSAIYHFALYFLRSRETINLYFGIFCINFILRLLTRGEKMMFELLPTSWWWVVSKGEFLFLFLIPILYLVYFNQLFKNRIKPIIFWFFFGIFSLFAVLGLLASLSFISKVLLFYQILGIISVSWIIYITFKAYIDKVPHSGIFLLGFIVLLAGVINDFLYFSYIFRVTEVFNYSCIIFIFTQAYNLADRSVKAFNREEELSKALDQKVSERTEQLSKANVVKGKLLSIVSHDLRGPLTSLHGLMELADGDHLDQKEEKRLFKSIKQSLDSSLTLLDNILAWASSQLQSNSVSPQLEPLDIENSINDSVSPYAQNLDKKNIKMKILVGKDNIVLADKNMLKSVLRNIISNAMKYSFENSIITISTKYIGERILISIADEGIGIPKEMIDLLNGSNWAKSRRGTANETGVGVGLLLCADLLNQMKSNLTYGPNMDNKGCIFSFSLPCP